MNLGAPPPQFTTLSFPPATMTSTGAKRCVQLSSQEDRRVRGENRKMPLAGFTSGRLRVRAAGPGGISRCGPWSTSLNETHRLQEVTSRLLLRPCGAAGEVGSSDLPHMLLVCGESDRRLGLEKSPESTTCDGRCSG